MSNRLPELSLIAPLELNLELSTLIAYETSPTPAFKMQPSNDLVV
jgi:hypothetical protein